ncbi:hypothetical protein PCANC_28919, partial [Puccinia coronata f. sp. avenae]
FSAAFIPKPPDLDIADLLIQVRFPISSPAPSEAICCATFANTGGTPPSCCLLNTKTRLCSFELDLPRDPHPVDRRSASS